MVKVILPNCGNITTILNLNMTITLIATVQFNYGLRNRP